MYNAPLIKNSWLNKFNTLSIFPIGIGFATLFNSQSLLTLQANRCFLEYQIEKSLKMCLLVVKFQKASSSLEYCGNISRIEFTLRERQH